MLLRAILPDLRLQTECAGMGPQPCVCAPRFGMKIAKTDRDSCKTWLLELNRVLGTLPLRERVQRRSSFKNPRPNDQEWTKNDQKTTKKWLARILIGWH